MNSHQILLTSFQLLWSGFALLGFKGQNNQNSCLDFVNLRLDVVSVLVNYRETFGITLKPV